MSSKFQKIFFLSIIVSFICSGCSGTIQQTESPPLANALSPVPEISTSQPAKTIIALTATSEPDQDLITPTQDLSLLQEQLLAEFLKGTSPESPVIAATVTADFSKIVYPENEKFKGKKIYAKVPIITETGLHAWWIFAYEYSYETQRCINIVFGFYSSGCASSADGDIQFILEQRNLIGKVVSIKLIAGTGGQSVKGIAFYEQAEKDFGINGQDWLIGDALVAYGNRDD